MEKLILRQLLAATHSKQDLLQFVYSANRSTEDAVLTVLHHVYIHLEKPKSYVRLLFLDFSSAFNTIQSYLMNNNLMKLDVYFTIILWIFFFLKDRPQQVRISTSTTEVISTEIRTDSGVPQGCLLSLAFFTLYTSDCRGSDEGIL